MPDSVPLFLLFLLLGVVVLGLLFLGGVAWISQQRQGGGGTRGDDAAALHTASNVPVDWVVLNTYLTPEPAHVDRAMLAGCDIDTQLGNEHTVSTDWLYGVAVGVELLVPREQLAEAQQLLVDARPETRATRDEPSIADVDHDDPEHRCPSCGSSEVYHIRSGRGIGLAALVLFALPLVGRRRYRCDRCGAVAE